MELCFTPNSKAGPKNCSKREAAGHPLLKHVDFQNLTRQAELATREFLDRPWWKGLPIAGFSICLCQLTSSLYLIRRLKQEYPHLTIIIGGSTFAQDSVLDLLRVFREIDYAVWGEGEIPLNVLVHHLLDSGPKHVPAIPGAASLNSPPDPQSKVFSQIKNLSLLPPPDFDDYFREVKNLPPDKTFFPVLTAEISRGCWWRQGSGRDETGGCAFCSLNRQWQGYRTKKPHQAVAEIDALTSRYQTLTVNFMDNLLPLKESRDIFERLAGLGKDLRIFAEIRANTPGDLLDIMAGAGLWEVQIGLEALSSSMLKKMNKGTTAVENLEIMKRCEELGLINTANLIVQFPGRATTGTWPKP